MRCAGAVAGERQMLAALERHRPDVVVLDYALGQGDGLTACFRLKQRAGAPGVVLYSAYADHVFAVPAAIAQADAIVAKSAPVDELLDAIRAVGAGRSTVPQPDPELLQAASSRFRADDLPVVGMLLARVPVPEIAETLDATPAGIRSRAMRIIGEMQARDRIGAAEAAAVTTH
jgi:DNA-binding NarL/FixJ family response regulator